MTRFSKIVILGGVAILLACASLERVLHAVVGRYARAKQM